MREASPSRDWYDWHQGYEADSGSHLVRRLEVVQELVGRALDESAHGRISVASLCAGQGDDLLGVLEGHSRAHDVEALLVELDGRNTAEIDRRAAVAGLVEVRSLTADAGSTDALGDVAPVDVLLLCGMLGNITMVDAERTIAAIPMLVRPAGRVVWTRRNMPVDQTPRLRAAFDAIGCTSINFVDPPDDKFTVGLECFDGAAVPFEPSRRLFDFVGFDRLIAQGE